MRRHLLLALLVGIVLTGTLKTVQARELNQGDMSASLSGGFSNDSFSIGGMFGYFVHKRIMAATRYTYSWESGSVYGVDYTAQQHDLDLFGRVYILTRGSFFPFGYAGFGYHHYGQSGDDPIPDSSYDFFSGFAGAGAMYLVGSHFGIEGTVGYRKFFSVPGEIEDSFDDSIFEWRLGFGLYF